MRWRGSRRKAKIFVVIGCLVLTIGAGAGAPESPAASASSRGFMMIDATALQRSRHAVEAGDPRLRASYARLIAAADAAMRDGPFSVMEKRLVPPSGDKHDYLSLAPYWWPNPATPDGLPYVRRDGQTNPEARTIPDKPHFDHVLADAHVLSLAYYMTQQPAYADHAARLLRAWFIAPDSRMNPNLTYAQIRRGHPGPNPFGIIDSRDLSLVIDAVGLLEGSPAWSGAAQEGMRKWFAEYLEWLLTSASGQGEARATNNHRAWYDQQVAAIAMFLGRTEVALSALRDARDMIIATQVAPDGSQPAELRRSRSWHYSLFNLEALFRLAALGRHVDLDLWRYETADGRGLRKALTYLVPYARREKAWPFREIGRWETVPMADLLLQAASAYKNPAYRYDARQIDAGEAERSWLNLLYPYFEARTGERTAPPLKVGGAGGELNRPVAAAEPAFRNVDIPGGAGGN